MGFESLWADWAAPAESRSERCWSASGVIVARWTREWLPEHLSPQT